MAELDKRLRGILERAHDELVGQLAGIVAQEEAARCDRLEDVITGGLMEAPPTALAYEREKSRLRELLHDIEACLGGRPRSADAWMARHIDGGRAAS
ncbi:MAG: hypothetical protein AAF909_11530 [Pseudomonadota bacterium]